ncbi:MAG TPA: NAD(P)-dependent alcohol dehydrogenase [Nocardioidaceae bacterium]
MTNQNRAAVLHGVHDLRLETRPVPEPGPHEVLVRVAAVGVCGSDVHYYEHGRIGEHVVRAPMVLGHEASGTVVATGSNAAKHRVGARVAMEPGVPCGRCRECRHGRYNLCPHVRFFATPPVDGAFADYVTIHEDFAFEVPDSVSLEAAALMEPLSVGIWACRKARVAPGDRVLVSGAGPIGLCAVLAARASGATDVTVTDISAVRLDAALRAGATRTLDVSSTSPVDSGTTADVLLECSGATTAVRDGILALDLAGRAVLVGMGEDEVPLPLARVQGRELEVTGTFRYANTYPTAVAMVAGGSVDLDWMVTGRFTLEESEKALLASRSDPSSIKAVVTPDRR